MKNNKGQILIEGMLLIVVFVGVFMTMTKYFQDKKVLNTFVVKPWEKVSGMAENGVWETPAAGKKLHPGSGTRRNTRSAKD